VTANAGLAGHVLGSRILWDESVILDSLCIYKPTSITLYRRDFCRSEDFQKSTTRCVISASSLISLIHYGFHGNKSARPPANRNPKGVVTLPLEPPSSPPSPRTTPSGARKANDDGGRDHSSAPPVVRVTPNRSSLVAAVENVKPPRSSTTLGGFDALARTGRLSCEASEPSDMMSTGSRRLYRRTCEKMAEVMRSKDDEHPENKDEPGGKHEKKTLFSTFIRL